MKRIFSLLLPVLLIASTFFIAAQALPLGPTHEVSWDHTLLDRNGNPLPNCPNTW